MNLIGLEQEERTRLAQECIHFEECVRKYVTIVRPGPLCVCLEKVRHKLLCADAGVLAFDCTLPSMYSWIPSYEGAIFVYSKNIVDQRSLLAAVISTAVSYERRGILVSVDELSFLLESEVFGVTKRILERPILGIYGFGSGTLPRKLPGILHYRRSSGLFGCFGITATEWLNVSTDVARTLGVFRDSYEEILL